MIIIIIVGRQEELHRVHHPHRHQPQAQARAVQVPAHQRPHDMPPGAHEGLQTRGTLDIQYDLDPDSKWHPS